MEKIWLCDLIKGECGLCPFESDCGIDFSTRRDKEEWIEMIDKKIEKFQKLLDKVKAL